MADVELKISAGPEGTELKMTGVSLKGDPGYTPQRGTDYWTEEDKSEVIAEATAAASEAALEIGEEFKDFVITGNAVLNDDNSLTITDVSATFEEIVAAHSEGKDVRLALANDQYSGTFFAQLYCIVENGVFFTAIENTCNFVLIYCNASNEWQGAVIGLVTNGTLVDYYKTTDVDARLAKKLDAGTRTDYVSQIGILGASEVNGKIVNDITVADKNGNFISNNLFTADQTPTQSSINLITSGAVYNAVEEVAAIAKGRATGLVFETASDMEAWLGNEENKGKLSKGDNLYIKATDVPDYWVCQPLEEQDAETGYFYEIAQLETQKVDLTEYVKNTDYATLNKGGVVKITSHFGTNVNATGSLYIVCATQNDISQKINNYRPITPSNLDYAVKSCTNQDSTAELTEEQLKLPPSTQYVKDVVGDIETALDNIITKYGLGGDSV